MKILLGKDRGKEGSVEYVMAKEGKVFVAGVNLYKRHVKKQATSEGRIIDIPKPLDISNVALICANCHQVTRIGFKKMGNDKVRVCRKCQKEIKDDKT